METTSKKLFWARQKPGIKGSSLAQFFGHGESQLRNKRGVLAGERQQQKANLMDLSELTGRDLNNMSLCLLNRSLHKLYQPKHQYLSRCSPDR